MKKVEDRTYDIEEWGVKNHGQSEAMIAKSMYEIVCQIDCRELQSMVKEAKQTV